MPKKVLTVAVKHSAIMATGTLTSRILGFVRDMLIAHILGARADIFIAAFRIPSMIRRLVADGSLGMSITSALSKIALQSRENICATTHSPQKKRVKYLPVLQYQKPEEFEKIEYFNRTEEQFLLVKQLFFTMFIIGVIISGILCLFGNEVMLILIPGIAKNHLWFQQGVWLFQICIWYLPLATASSVIGAVLMSVGNFTVPSLSPLFLNICMIISGFIALLLSSHLYSSTNTFFVSLTLCIGVLIGGMAQLVWQLSAYLKLIKKALAHFKRSLSLFSIKNKHPSVFSIFTRLPLTTFSASSQQINILIAAIAASYFAEGSISALYFAERLIEFPIALAGSTISMAFLPDIAKLVKKTYSYDFFIVTNKSLKISLFFSLPAAAGLYALAYPITKILFAHGAFDQDLLLKTSKALSIFALGLPAMCLAKPLTSAFTAINPSGSWKAALFSIFAMVVMTLLLSSFFEAIGVAISTCLASWIYLFSLLFEFKTNGYNFLSSKNSLLCLLLTFLAFLLGLFLYLVTPNVESRLLLASTLIVVIIGGMILWLGLLWLLAKEEITEWLKTVKRKK